MKDLSAITASLVVFANRMVNITLIRDNLGFVSEVPAASFEPLNEESRGLRWDWPMGKTKLGSSRYN